MQGRNEIKLILVVGTQRSGTTWLMQVLAQNPKFKVYGEAFREIYSHEFKGDPDLKPSVFYKEFCENEKNTDPLVYIEKHLAVDGKITVVKVMYDQIRRAPRLIRMLSSKNTLVLNFERENLFDITLSKLIARKSGVYHSAEVTNYNSFSVPYRKVKAMLWKEDIKKRVFPKLIEFFSPNYKYCTYEKLLVDFAELELFINSFNSISPFSFSPKTTKWKKAPSKNKRAAIANLDEIKAKLKKTRFSGYVK